MSQELFAALMDLHSGGADLRGIAESLRGLVAARSEEDDIDHALEQEGLTGLRRFLPKGQANVLSFCSLVVAIATLVESVVAAIPGPASIPVSGPQVHATASLDISVIQISHPASSPVGLRGQFNSAEDLSPWIIKASSLFRGMHSAWGGRRPGKELEALRCGVAGDTWACRVDPPSVSSVEDWYLVVVLMPAGFRALPSSTISHPQRPDVDWLSQPVAGPVAQVTIGRKFRGNVGWIWQAAFPFMETVPHQSLGDLLFSRIPGIPITPARPARDPDG